MSAPKSITVAIAEDPRGGFIASIGSRYVEVHSTTEYEAGLRAIHHHGSMAGDLTAARDALRALDRLRGDAARHLYLDTVDVIGELLPELTRAVIERYPAGEVEFTPPRWDAADPTPMLWVVVRGTGLDPLAPGDDWYRWERGIEERFGLAPMGCFLGLG